MYTKTSLITDLMNLAWPNLCLLCERPLVKGENHLCMNCLYEIPKTRFPSFQINPSADRFYGKIPFEKSTAGYLYHKESKLQQALELLKYKGEKEVGECLGRFAAASLIPSGFFDDIDLLIPVPLHKKKERIRGYNQSEWIAKGLSRVSSIPYQTNCLRRNTENSTQTTKSIWERWENTQGLFSISNSADILGKHILLVDDVLTSGSTLEACGKAILAVPDTKISFFALAIA